MADQQQGARRIERLKKGDKARTAMHADVMNEIIDAVNALYQMKIADNLGTVTFSDSNMVIKFNTTTECPDSNGGGIDGGGV